MLVRPITKYGSAISRALRQTRGLGVKSFLPAAFQTHRRWYLADGSIANPSSEIVDGDDHRPLSRHTLAREVANRLSVSHIGQQFSGVGVRNRPTFDSDFNSDLSDHILSGLGVAAPTRTLNTADVTDPLGGNTATKLEFPAISTAGHLTAALINYGADQASLGQTIWIRGASGGEQTYHWIQALSGTNESVLRTVTTEWQKFTRGGVSRALVELGVDLRAHTDHTAKPAATIYVWGDCTQNQFAFGLGTVDGDDPIIVTKDNLQWPNTGGQLISANCGTVILVVVPEANTAEVVSVLQLFSTRTGVPVSGITLNYEADDSFHFFVFDAGAILAELLSTTSIVQGRPNVVACAWEDGDVRLAIDGVQEASAAPVGMPSTQNATLYFGQNELIESPFAGILGPMMTFKRALTLSQQNSVINQVLAPLYPGRLRMKG